MSVSDVQDAVPLFLGPTSRVVVLVFLTLLGGGAPLIAQQPREIVSLFSDFNGTPEEGSPLGFLVHGDRLYFSARDGTHGIELWETDGTNVTRLTDLTYGSAHSFVSSLASYGGDIYFRGSGTTNGAVNLELWKLSGTNASQVAEIAPGPGNSQIRDLAVFNGVLYFAASDGTSGTELWAYDGFSAYQVIDLNPGAASSSPSGLTVYNGFLCFAADDGVTGMEFWAFNGGGFSYADVYPGPVGSDPSGFREAMGDLFFQATEPGGGAELWAFTGTGLYGVDVVAGPSGSSPAHLREYNGDLYFSANDGVNGTELWTFDGIFAPMRVTQIAPGGLWADPSDLEVFSNELYFAASDSTNGVELWKYDGSTATRVADINPGSADSSPGGLTTFNGALYFAATDVPTGRELWRYDGSTVSRFAEIHGGSDGSIFGPGAEYEGDYYLAVSGTNEALYKYDGSTFEVVTTTHVPEFGSGMVVYNGALHFVNDGGSIQDQIWRYDGTNFTSLGGVFPGNFSWLTEYNGILYFSGRNNTYGSELWKCDGTNVSFAVDIRPGDASASPYALRVFNGYLYFYATDATGFGIFRFDGTSATRVGNFIPGGLGGMVEFDDCLYLGGRTNGVANEPWKFDGTNFTQAAQINVLDADSGVTFWTVHENSVYFSADDGLHGRELWAYDGTNATRITDMTDALYAFSFAGNLYFMGDDGVSGFELWKVAGAGVTQVADINPGFGGSYPTPHRAFKDAFHFEADDGLHGTELWRLDPVSHLVRITSFDRQGNDVALSWTTPGGMSNVLQSASGDMGGGFTTNFTDLGSPITAPTGGIVTLDYLHVGGATNGPGQYYRVRVP